MSNRRGILAPRLLHIVAGTVMAFALASAAVFATTYTNGIISLTVPAYTVTNPLYHCEPQLDETARQITVSGIPEGSRVLVNFGLSGGPGTTLINISQTFLNQSGTETYQIPYPEPSSAWPYNDGTIRAIWVAASVAVFTPTGQTIKVNSKQWKIVCRPDLPDPESKGCTPGYWKQFDPPNDEHLASWLLTSYRPGDDFGSVFGVLPGFSPSTLGDALSLGGGPGVGERNAMARHAVAALLNAANPGVNYPMTEAQIIAAVANAYATGNFRELHYLFEGYNEIGCPLNGEKN